MWSDELLKGKNSVMQISLTISIAFLSISIFHNENAMGFVNVHYCQLPLPKTWKLHPEVWNNIHIICCSNPVLRTKFPSFRKWELTILTINIKSTGKYYIIYSIDHLKSDSF